MHRAEPPWTNLALGVGILTLRLECNQVSLGEALKQRYKAFTVDAGEPDLKLRIILSEQTLELISAGAQINSSGTQITFTYPGFKGEINLERGDGRLILHRPDPMADIQLFLSLALNTLALQRGGFLVHAAGIAHHGRGFVFLGPSGAGKTTLSRLSTGDVVLNDDLTLVMPENGRWMVCGTPFTNPHQAEPHPDCAPLGALLRLRQSPGHRLEALAPAAALAELVSSVALLANLPPLAPRVVEIAGKMLDKLPCFTLHFRKDAMFWKLIDEQLGLA